MNADWVAASVRARALARRRVGAGECLALAALPTLADAIARLDDSAYAERLAGVTSLRAAQRATWESVLWQLRVLAGWLPAGATQLLRAVAARYELDNIVALARRLGGDDSAPDPFDLGALATAWPDLRLASSPGELSAALRRSPWGDPGDQPGTASVGMQNLRDTLTVVWLRRLASAAPAARIDAATACALIVARIRLVDRAEPSTRVRLLARPLLGTGWEAATTLTDLQQALPPALRSVFSGVSGSDQLWQAEAALRAQVGADGARLVRGALPSPQVVLGAVALLATDAWRVDAALAAASAGLGRSEVLDAVA